MLCPFVLSDNRLLVAKDFRYRTPRCCACLLRLLGLEAGEPEDILFSS